MVHSRGELPVTVRALEAADHAGLVALFRECFPAAARRPADEVERKLGQLFIDGPLCRPPRQSLVAIDESDSLVGFQGMLVRRWKLGDEFLMGRCGTHSMVHPDARRMGVSAKLIRRWREMREGLSVGWIGFSDQATSDSRGYYGKASNQTSLHHDLPQLGFRWQVSRGGRLAEMRRALRPGAKIEQHERAPLRAHPLDAASLGEAFAALGERFPLRLDEPPETCQWLAEYLNDYPSRGAFRGAVLCGENGAPVGFYCGYLKEQHLEVVGMGALPERQQEVLDTLLRDAPESGARTVAGWASAAELRAVLAAGAVIGAGVAAGVTTPRADVLHHFQAMETLITGLEGERWT